jgi:hypothetical protein
MRAVVTLLAVALLAGCAPKADEAPAPPAAPTLADFAGTYTLSATLTGVATPVPSTMTGTADATSWTISLEGRPNIPLTVAVVGDSLISTTVEYESVLRPGVMVVTRTAAVVKDGALSGNITATYKKSTGDEVVTGMISGTKNP